MIYKSKKDEAYIDLRKCKYIGRVQAENELRMLGQLHQRGKKKISDCMPLDDEARGRMERCAKDWKFFNAFLLPLENWQLVSELYEWYTDEVEPVEKKTFHFRLKCWAADNDVTILKRNRKGNAKVRAHKQSRV